LLLPQLPRPHKSSIGARVHREPAQASPVLSSGFDSSISQPFSTISRFGSFAEDAVTTLILTHGVLAMSVAPPSGQNRIMIYGPKPDGTYIVEFRIANGE
jgi:hypothetical protein